jgi:hypothetical protein
MELSDMTIQLSKLINKQTGLVRIAATCLKSTILKKNKFRSFSPQSELYQPSDRRLAAKLVPTLADRGCRVVSATSPHSRQ